MLTLASWAGLTLLVIGLSVPLALAIRTLLALQGKTVYPILRTVGADGNSVPLVRLPTITATHPSNGRTAWSQSVNA
jgi:hypothetical protein